ncbi:MAG: type II secretion system protein [Gemmatimonadetes bacterium]|nr:type II secretion system protein [Gemmatimonadota bacterium]MBL0180349.1 type II secretion system protein [Gemmatimonadota bacterium]
MRNNRGVTLFETVAAMTLVAITAVSAMAAVGAELRTAEKARHTLEAEALATTRLDQLALLTDRELLSLPDTIAQGDFEAPLADYSWETTSAASNAQAGVYDVVVTVSWPTGRYTITSALYRRPAVPSAR